MVCWLSSNGTTTRFTGFESVAGAPGICTCTVTLPAVATSLGLIVVVQLSGLRQTLSRAAPSIRITGSTPAVVETNPRPFNASVKLDATPAITLDGSICSMLGPLVIVSTAVALAPGSDALVAVSAIAFGEGALPGAVYVPEEMPAAEAAPDAVNEPHVATAQGVPATVLESVQVTAVLVVPVTCAVNGDS